VSRPTAADSPVDARARPTLSDPDTPFAVVDRTRLERNIARLSRRLGALGIPLRPHVKTAKSVEVARLLFDGNAGPITVSTLAEAEAFSDVGFSDITYAVGIDPHKLPRVAALHRGGVRLTVLLDSLEQARAVVAAGQEDGLTIPALVEVDCDGHRGGVQATGAELVEIGRTLADVGSLDGVLLHAGESYFARSEEDLATAAEKERATAVAAADSLRAAGLEVPTVSVGSTPTAHAARDLTGVTEVRAGNYVFFDLVMAGLGVCSIGDIALSVVVTVIGHRPDLGWVITDGGWMAMSRDRGTAVQAVDQGYGLVTDLSGRLLPDLVMTGASQEHGTLSVRPGADTPLPALPIGTRLRILPNHACATAAQHQDYQVIGSDEAGTGQAPLVEAVWPRVGGW
jgi:D-serine deaminase-like pyridoxal phosphate-dependent protein